MIAKNDTLEISQVGNGFIVRRAHGNWYGDDRDQRIWLGEKGDYLVFRTLSELQQWLSEHFTHRAAPKLVDDITHMARADGP